MLNTKVLITLVISTNGTLLNNKNHNRTKLVSLSDGYYILLHNGENGFLSFCSRQNGEKLYNPVKYKSYFKKYENTTYRAIN